MAWRRGLIALVRLPAAIAFERMRFTPDDRVWTAIPLFHGGGITFALSCVTAGATFVHPGFFDPATTPAYLEDERVTVALAAFETIWLPVLDHPDLARRDLSRIRLVMVVGVPERLRDMASRLPGATHVSCVAMTESSAFLTLNRLDDPLDKRVTGCRVTCASSTSGRCRAPRSRSFRLRERIAEELASRGITEAPRLSPAPSR